eukprot:scaffold1282_cov251-Pinguiococcus_pyrenoidosus.AAC.33
MRQGAQSAALVGAWSSCAPDEGHRARPHDGWLRHGLGDQIGRLAERRARGLGLRLCRHGSAACLSGSGSDFCFSGWSAKSADRRLLQWKEGKAENGRGKDPGFASAEPMEYHSAAVRRFRNACSRFHWMKSQTVYLVVQLVPRSVQAFVPVVHLRRDHAKRALMRAKLARDWKLRAPQFCHVMDPQANQFAEFDPRFKVQRNSPEFLNAAELALCTRSVETSWCLLIAFSIQGQPRSRSCKKSAERQVCWPAPEAPTRTTDHGACVQLGLPLLVCHHQRVHRPRAREGLWKGESRMIALRRAQSVP